MAYLNPAPVPMPRSQKNLEQPANRGPFEYVKYEYLPAERRTDQVITFKERINGCMRRSMNGKNLPEDGPEMEALIAYIKFLGHGTPEGVRVAGMGLLPLADPPLAADSGRGGKVYADLCANCHKDEGQGERNQSPQLGYSIPPLWGDDSFNAASGMAKLAYAAAYVRANMPFGVRYLDPVLSEQQAWDVAAT
jgi:thiosulfate dehydrogenase